MTISYSAFFAPTVLGEDTSEHFKVLTRGAFGYGFGKPAMYAVFRPLAQCKSMEVGESLMGFLCRTPIRQHKMGHETRYGPGAGGNNNFVTKGRREAVLKFFKAAMGLAEVATNFDHTIQYVWPDVKGFEDKKWATIVSRLIWWGKAYGFMYVTKSINPYLFPMFYQEAQAARKKVKTHVEFMLREALDIPKLEVSWGNECFTDQRLGFEMMKFLVTQGPLSLGTAVERAGYNAEEEEQRKVEEAGKNEKLFVPIFDAAHGDKAGRKKGTPDPK